MKHLKWIITCGVLLLALYKPASATTCTTFYTWLTGDTITAARLNGNNTNLVTCGNAIDFNNIGTSGIKASNMKGTVLADNTFGFTTAATQINVPIILGASAITCPTAVCLFNDNGGTAGMILNVPTGSTNAFRFEVNGTAVAQIGNAGAMALSRDLTVAPTINSVNTAGHVPPVYDITGADVAASMHIVEGTVSTTIASTNCLAFTACTLTGGSGTKTLTNAAVFVDTNYRCNATSLVASSTEYGFLVTKTSGSSVTFTAVNNSNVTQNIGSFVLFDFWCIGA